MKKLHIPLNIILLLIASTLQSAIANEKSDDNDFHISFGAAFNKPADQTLQNSNEFSFQLASSIKSVQVGIEAAIQYQAPADYTYKVPYNQLKENRNLNIYSGFLILRYSPWHDGVITPYLGGFFGGSLIMDNAPDSAFFDNRVSTDKVLLAGPALGIELLPDALISIFIEARKSFQISGQLERPEITSVDAFGEIKKTTKTYSIDAMSLTAGFRFNF